MTRKALDEALENLNAQVSQMGSQVNKALAQTLEALTTADQEIADVVVMNDSTIDDLHLTIEEHTFRILSLQQPLYGHDLRFLTSVVPIALDLERIGDEAESIAQNLLRLLPLHFADVASVMGEHIQQEAPDDQYSEGMVLYKVLEFGQKVYSLFQQTMQALNERDAQQARKLWEEDILVDRQYYRVDRDATALLEQKQGALVAPNNSLQTRRVVALLWIAHAFDRMAGHCANICERIVFIVEGEMEMHPDSYE